VSSISVTSLNGQPLPARAQTAVEFGRHRPPPLATPPRRRIGDEVSTRDDEDAEPRPTRTLLLIDDVRLRRECLFRLLSAELPDFDVLAFATTQPPETWAATSPDIVLANAPSGDSGDGLPIGEIVAAANGAPVLLLTESEGDHAAPAAEESGVAGRFPSACGTELLIAAIQLVLAGGRFQIPARPASKMAWRPNSGAPG
jgi:DNA-binding NarL/FixJ family response regulator